MVKLYVLSLELLTNPENIKGYKVPDSSTRLAWH